jgi:hypothetical protein
MTKRHVFHQFRSWTHTFWSDQSGEASTMSLILICTIIAIGATVGLTTLRDQVTLEFGDVALAIENLDQSFDAGAYGSYVDPGPSSTPLIVFP